MYICIFSSPKGRYGRELMYICRLCSETVRETIVQRQSIDSPASAIAASEFRVKRQTLQGVQFGDGK